MSLHRARRAWAWVALIPVHVLYWTAWVDREGDLHFRRDVYDRDGPLGEALREGPLRYQ